MPDDTIQVAEPEVTQLTDQEQKERSNAFLEGVKAEQVVAEAEEVAAEKPKEEKAEEKKEEKKAEPAKEEKVKDESKGEEAEAKEAAEKAKKAAKAEKEGTLAEGEEAEESTEARDKAEARLKEIEAKEAEEAKAADTGKAAEEAAKKAREEAEVKLREEIAKRDARIAELEAKEKLKPLTLNDLLASYPEDQRADAKELFDSQPVLAQGLLYQANLTQQRLMDATKTEPVNVGESDAVKALTEKIAALETERDRTNFLGDVTNGYTDLDGNAVKGHADAHAVIYSDGFESWRKENPRYGRLFDIGNQTWNAGDIIMAISAYKEAIGKQAKSKADDEARKKKDLKDAVHSETLRTKKAAAPSSEDDADDKSGGFALGVKDARKEREQ